MTLEELKKKLRDSLADAKERGVRIPRSWFWDNLESADLKEIGLKVCHSSTSPYSWIKHEKGDIRLLEVNQFCHCHDMLCIATTSKDDALEVITAYQFLEGDEGLVAHEVDLMSLPAKGAEKAEEHPDLPDLISIIKDSLSK